ncbi:hemicentin-1-like [Dendronephthya gigantea]|uniref:hemicentin-1-like n=1 Tax=Dendronephthya gigantea TaxID=151771 RepID=UPI00106B77E3|nr:hemicentin-1-like [Dendronephthya gigantea]XP_028411179.1 hemicentin-1-like [Dendronephthya gigantea]
MFVAASLSLLLLAIGNISANQCSPTNYDTIIKAGPSLPADEIISRHNVTSSVVMLGCHTHCKDEDKCVGFNYRTTKNVENCQLTNVTRKKEETKLTGYWILMILMRNVEAAKKAVEEENLIRKSDVHECSLGTHKCHSNATCNNTIGSYECHCHGGFAGNGKTCLDVDECSLGTHKCHSNATCNNTIGSYECHCRSGFLGNGKTCSDVDECSLGAYKCHSNATCNNTIGSYECHCRSGFAGNGKTCSDVDECSLGTHKCHSNATCNNTIGSYECHCRGGFLGNGITCSEVDECSLGTHKCHSNATCNNTIGSYECHCRRGFAGNGTTCSDVNECSLGTHKCHSDATCNNTIGSYECHCRRGFAGNGKTCLGLRCADLYEKGTNKSGIYEIDPDGKGSFKVFCDMTTSGGGWTVFQRRLDGSVDFYRGWQDYKHGFGNFSGEYWLGLDKIQRMTNISQNELRIDMEDTSGNTRYAHYDSFNVSSEIEKYKLNVRGYHGTAGNSLGRHDGMAFTTKDSDNDIWDGGNCGVLFKGAWWYYDGHESNLNGLYRYGPYNLSADGVNWNHWKGNYYSLKSTSMKIRPREFGKKK